MRDVKKTYTNGDIIIGWESEKCIHSGNCARGLSSVFKPRETPWIQPDGVSSETIKNQILNCPSGALTFSYKEK